MLSFLIRSQRETHCCRVQHSFKTFFYWDNQRTIRGSKFSKSVSTELTFIFKQKYLPVILYFNCSILINSKHLKEASRSFSRKTLVGHTDIHAEEAPGCSLRFVLCINDGVCSCNRCKGVKEKKKTVSVSRTSKISLVPPFPTQPWTCLYHTFSWRWKHL